MLDCVLSFTACLLFLSHNYTIMFAVCHGLFFSLFFLIGMLDCMLYVIVCLFFSLGGIGMQDYVLSVIVCLVFLLLSLIC